MHNEREHSEYNPSAPHPAPETVIGFGPDIAATCNAEPARLIKALQGGENAPDIIPSDEQTQIESVPVQIRIERFGMLHNVNGRLNARGYLTDQLLRYDRSRIKANRLRVKEWNRYLISDDDYVIWLTVANFGYVGRVSARVTNLVHPSSRAVAITVPMPGNRLVLPSRCFSGQIAFRSRRGRFVCRASDEGFRIMANYDEFLDGETLAVDALLDCRPSELFGNVSAWPDDPRTFYYQLSVPAMRASGSFKVGSRVHGFSPTRSFGLHSWHRAVLPYEIRHTWAVAQGWQDGQGGSASDTHLVGVLIGEGEDVSAASPNAFFLDGKLYKLGQLTIDIPNETGTSGERTLADRYQFLHAWKVTDRSGQVDLTFVPVTEGTDRQNAAAISLDSHQVFGAFSGTIKLPGGDFLIDRLPGCAVVEHLRG